MKYVIHTRASKIKMDNGEVCENAHSHDMQLRECLEIIGDAEYVHFRESNTSGDTPLDKRSVLLESLKALSAGDTLLVWRCDRLYRSVDTMIKIRYLLDTKKANAISVVEKNIFGDDPFSIMICTILAAINECNLAGIRSAITSTMRTKISKGEALGTIPYGYAKKGVMLVPNPQEQKILDKMQSMVDRGIGYRQIAEALNSQGIENRNGGKHRQGAPWTHSAVHRVLKARSLHSERLEARSARDEALFQS